MGSRGHRDMLAGGGFFFFCMAYTHVPTYCTCRGTVSVGYRIDFFIYRNIRYPMYRIFRYIELPDFDTNTVSNAFCPPSLGIPVYFFG